MESLWLVRYYECLELFSANEMYVDLKNKIKKFKHINIEKENEIFGKVWMV